jgi:hypothetical protein
MTGQRKSSRRGVENGFGHRGEAAGIAVSPNREGATVSDVRHHRRPNPFVTDQAWQEQQWRGTGFLQYPLALAPALPRLSSIDVSPPASAAANGT